MLQCAKTLILDFFAHEKTLSKVEYFSKIAENFLVLPSAMFPILGTNLCLILDAENQLFRIMAHGHAKKFVPLWTQIVVNNLKIKDIM